MSRRFCSALVAVVICMSVVENALITDLDLAYEFLEADNLQVQNVYSASSAAAWEYYTNITEENRIRMVGTKQNQ